MYLFKLNYSVLVFSPLGFLCRLLMIYVFQTDGIYGQLFAVFIINVIARQGVLCYQNIVLFLVF